MTELVMDAQQATGAQSVETRVPDRPTPELTRALPVEGVTKSAKTAEDADRKGLDKALELKKLRMNQTFDVLVPLSEKREVDVETLMDKVDRDLSESSIYAATLEEGGVLRDASEIKKDAMLLLSKFQIMPSLLPEGTSLEMITETVSEYMNFLGDKRVYAGEGIEGLLDVLTDSFIAEQVARKRLGENPDLDIVQYLPQLPAAERTVIGAFLTQGLEEEAGKEIESMLSDDTRQEYQDKFDKAEASEYVKIMEMQDAIGRVARTFSFENIDINDYADLPLEVQYLLGLDPRYEQIIRGLESKGVSLQLQKIVSTPKDILQSISRISVTSQENFIKTWLPDLIKNGNLPRLTSTDRGVERAKGLDLIEGDEEITEMLDNDVARISQAVNRFMIIEGLGEGLDDGSQAMIDELNKGLGDTRIDYTLRRMIFDNADERTSEAQAIIKKLMFVGPVAHALEHLNMGQIAKLFAASADDLGAEWAEIKALSGSGFSKKDLLKRGKVLLPVFAAATYGATRVEHLLHEGKDLQAGAIFGASAVALSLTTSIQSVRMYHEAYKDLVDQAKVPGLSGLPASVVEALNTLEFKTAFSEMEKSQALLDPAHREELFAFIKKTLEDTLPADAVSDVMTALESSEMEHVTKLMQKPKVVASVKEAIKQDFSNPARLGLLLGSSMAPVVGMIAGKAGGLNNGFIMAAVGSVESVMSGATVIAAKRYDEFKYKLSLKRKVKENERSAAAA